MIPDITASLTVDSLFDLDTATVQSQKDQLAQLLQEMFPSMYLKRGVIFDYVLGPAAMFAAMHAKFWQNVQQSNSLLAISQNPSLADANIVDVLASNYRIAVSSGEKASGNIALVVSANSPLAIPAGATFAIQGLSFTTTSAFSVRDTAALVQSATDRLLTALNDGTYVFTISATALAAGAAGNVRKNAVVVPTNVPPNFVRAYAASDFTGGSDAESNAVLSNRLLAGVAAQVLSGPVNMTALLSRFGGVIADSVIGMGKPELKRDKHSIFPGATGGKMDWYIKTRSLPQNVGLTKSATLVAIAADGHGQWSFSLGRDEAPGFYDVTSITLPAMANYAGSFPIISDTRGADLAVLDNDGFLPDIINVQEAAYTRFQTTTIVFQDTTTVATGLALGATQEYAVSVRVLPFIAEIQDLVSAEQTRNPMGDCLVRAAIPCFVRISFVLRLAPNQAAPDQAALAVALADAVNSTGFSGVLPASILTDVIQNTLSGGAYVDAIEMIGKLQRPDGTWRLLRSRDVLTVPEEFSQCVSPRTTVFYLDPADVAISVSVVSSLDS